MTDMSTGLVEFPRADQSLWWNVGKSWMSLKWWVKIWLIVLNMILLGSIGFLYDPIGKFTIAAYAASGPLLIALMVRPRGLSRLLGVGHIVPWVPLLFYLLGRLVSNQFGPKITISNDLSLYVYTLVTISALSLCLMWHFWDVFRWIKGERYTIGSADAFDSGASALADISKIGKGSK